MSTAVPISAPVDSTSVPVQQQPSSQQPPQQQKDSKKGKEGKKVLVPITDLDFDFFEKKVKEVICDMVHVAIKFDEEIFKIGKEGYINEKMPTQRLRDALETLSKGDIGGFTNVLNSFTTDIDDKSQIKYRDYNLLLFNPLTLLNNFLGQSNTFEKTIREPIVTNVNTTGEVALRRKNGTVIDSVFNLEDIAKVKELTKKHVIQATDDTHYEPVGQEIYKQRTPTKTAKK